ncbi:MULTISPECIES: hypothetical protein [unclassified Calothrix]|nr:MULTISPECIES: hypothetical protein [unclassified Calothrix]
MPNAHFPASPQSELTRNLKVRVSVYQLSIYLKLVPMGFFPFG